jgi:alcohol dehydrogenase (NADP+)
VVQLGLVNEPHPVNQVAMLWTRTGLSGSLIGGMRATQEVVDLCAEKKIYPKVEVVPCSRIDSVFQELNSKSATVQRFVLDIANTLDGFVAAKTQQ